MSNMLLNINQIHILKKSKFQTSSENYFFDFIGPKVTSNDLGGQIYIRYVTSVGNLCIHAKNWVSVCYC